MLKTISQFFTNLPHTSQAAIIASAVILIGALFAAVAAFVVAYIKHRGNERRFRKQLEYDRKQKRIERQAEIVINPKEILSAAPFQGQRHWMPDNAFGISGMTISTSFTLHVR